MQTGYTRTAIGLHWIIAITIIGLLVMGHLMQQEWMPNRSSLYGLHKSFGILILVLTVFRIVWRLTHRPPALPDSVPNWQVLASRAVHIGFYVLLIAMPLLGWAMSSASTRAPQVEIFGLFPIPDLPVDQGPGASRQWAQLHGIGAKLMIALLVLHIGAALKHHVVDRDGVLARMWPWAKSR